MRNPLDATKRPVQVAVGLTGGGFLLIVLGWNGAANVDYAQGQLPYLISGGVAGLALVLVGLALLVIDQLKRSTAEVLAGLDRASEATAAAAGPTAVPGSGPRVVAGRATYHLPTCRLVVERNDLQTMSPDAAVDRGLAACRICRASEAATG